MNTKIILLAVTVAFCTLSLKAQQDERLANNNYKAANYVVALKLYKKLLVKDTANIEYLFRLGDCSLNCNTNPAEALTYLKKIENAKKDNVEYYFMLAKAYLYNYDFELAKFYFDKCKTLANKNVELKNLANVWFQMTENAARMVKTPLDVSFINLGKFINTEMDELTPYVTNDNEMLLYTSNNKYDPQFLIYSYDVYFSPSDDGSFKKGKPLAVVNTLDDEFIAGVSLNNEKAFVQLQGFEGFQDLIYTERKTKGFQGKFGLDGNINTEYAEFGAFETSEGDTLFFSSGREGGMGGMDLYYSLRLPTGDWGTPRNLGDRINTAYDEDLPVLSNDGQKLYFTSNRPESMGGFDIFECNIQGELREFSQPQNIGYPLNDVFDNKTIAYSDNERYAYVSAIKPDGIGSTDLYRVVFNQMDPAVKILVLNFKNTVATSPYAATDTTLKVAAYQKGKVVFGQYSYDQKNSLSTIALPPGSYTIEISGVKTEEYTHKIVVPDTPSGDKIEKQDIILKPKN